MNLATMRIGREVVAEATVGMTKESDSGSKIILVLTPCDAFLFPKWGDKGPYEIHLARGIRREIFDS